MATTYRAARRQPTITVLVASGLMAMFIGFQSAPDAHPRPQQPDSVVEVISPTEPAGGSSGHFFHQ